MSGTPTSQVWNLPNILTMLRIALVPFFAWFLLADAGEHGLWRWAALAVFAVAMYTDKLDGDIARARGLITDFGKIADPIADKLLTGAAFVILSVLGEIPWWATLIILVREWGITLLRLVVIRYGVIPASSGGKIKTVLQTVVLFLYLLPLTAQWMWLGVAAFVLLLATVAVTLVTGLQYVFLSARLIRGGSRA
ncbi:CDP-diacylglycerol--glycerol-3-phosphate 3-phosphatidyltransferase [Arthrobacter woluwensis]|uniref:CDP-diacylglycerol--glycerol-3-phosphate 3-phosphatidyltransferase n=1 Tax=Arthrobacter woluwensis TaxID=156980 RepID=UPI001AAECD66|nr:CDP-diacylglycerol--glycerol-3-phosphate 3-phosphatidyltransferase [Arthrobacter woluwensis]QTF71042.1 CDP-diacylglycerol--glycerol-3-phosphate 3-phosphatidyltransferase [Arthrobacter woluwensis]